MHFRVCSSAGTQGDCIQDASKGGSGICRSAQCGLLQPPFSSGEGDGGLEAGHQFIHPQWRCHPDQVMSGDSSVGFGVDAEGQFDVLHQPQRCLLPDPHPSGLLPISPVCSRPGWANLFQPEGHIVQNP